MTAEFEGARMAAEQVKGYDPSIHVLFGGQHPTVVPRELLETDYCDFVCIGEGEETFGQLIQVFSAGGDLAEVNGLAYRNQQGKFLQNAPRALVNDVDSIPFPAYHLLDLDRYVQAESARYPPKYPRAIQIFTSRGCPWRCTYCHTLFGKQFRPRSPENVLAEMKMLYHDYQIQEFMVEDDIFNFDLERAKRICDLIIEEGLEVGLQFGNGVRLERFDEELIQKLAAAGTHQMALAIESASPRLQSDMKKYLKLHMVKDVVRWAKKYKIVTTGFFMIGFPGETLEEMKMTIRFACETDLDEALFSVVIPYSGTEMHKQLLKSGQFENTRSTDELRDVIRVETEDFDFATLKRMQRRAYFMFFMTRFRFLKMLPKLFSLRSSRKYLKAIERNFFPESMTGKVSRAN